MNNVLGAILGLASANVDTLPDTSPARKAFETIIKATERGSKMVKSLLSFARKETDETQPVDLNRILQEEVSILERTTLAKVHMELDLAGDLRLICGDESALSHAIMNLCVNAVDAMPEPGTLTLRTRNLADRRVEVQVQDTGTGMSRETLDRAMDPFFTTKGIGKGTGLGLSMVYSTVQAHHGEIEIQSEPGLGTLVALRFPVCERAEALLDGGDPSRPGAGVKGLMVLLVDDDDLMQISTGAVLESLGCSVLQARSGEHALGLFAAGLKVDAVILDMNMPGLGGWGTLVRLREATPCLPVLVSTGHVEPGLLDLIAADRNCLMLAKPFTRDELGTKLEAAVRALEIPAYLHGGPEY
jgi:CheY-like chemotaxis protein